MNLNPIEYLISLLSPEQCRICYIDANMVCDDCYNKLFLDKDSRCYICNKMTTQNQICSSCRSNSRLRRVWWLGLYGDPIKAYISDMKFGRKRAYARRFGVLLADRIPYLPDDTIVFPAPTASSRIRQRGFDQAVLIAQSLASARQLSISKDGLIRQSQVDQIGKHRSERIKQMKGCFALRSPESVKGKNILLVDDVITTGATLESAAATLRQNGAKHVDAAIVARHIFGKQ